MMRAGGLRKSLLALLLLWHGASQADFEEDYEKKNWKEIEIQLPAAPRAENLIPFYVSAATTNQFLIDGSSLSVDVDGVVRYVMVVVSPEGARSVTYEGMRCEAKERRIYASGHADGTWAKSRRNEWVRIQDATANRQHAALFLEYFCPGGVIVNNPEQARAALRSSRPGSIYR